MILQKLSSEFQNLLRVNTQLQNENGTISQEIRERNSETDRQVLELN